MLKHLMARKNRLASKRFQTDKGAQLGRQRQSGRLRPLLSIPGSFGLYFRKTVRLYSFANLQIVYRNAVSRALALFAATASRHCLRAELCRNNQTPNQS